MVEENEADQDANETESGQSDGSSLGYLKGVCIAAIWVFLALLLVAIFWPNLTERTKFFTGNLLNLLIAFAVIAQVLIYRKQWQVMEKSLIVGARAYVEVHSIEAAAGGIVNVKIENVGQIPATKVRAACTVYAIKDGKKYKPSRFSMEFDRLSRGNLNIEFTFNLGQFFTIPEVIVILGEGLKLPTFLEFRIHFNDGFTNQVSDSIYCYLGKPRDIWLPVADIKRYGIVAEIEGNEDEVAAQAADEEANPN